MSENILLVYNKGVRDMLKNLISIVMPTVRLGPAVDTIRQTLATSHGHLLEYIVVTEQVPVRDATITFLQSYERANLDSFQVLYQEEARGPVQAWNDGLCASHGEYVAFWADDLWPYPGWLDMAMPYFDQFPERVGYVGFNDLIWDGNKLTTHYIVHREYVIKYQHGILAYPHYERICNDTESWARARKAGLWAWAEDAIVEHLHPMVGKRERDEYDDLMLAAFHGDYNLYLEREAIGFPDNFEPVITE